VTCQSNKFIILVTNYGNLLENDNHGQNIGAKKRPKSDVKAAPELLSHLKKKSSIFGNRKLPASKSILEN
jgi:hypothetical protein